MTSTSYITNENLNPINDNFSNESFILPEVINSLPIKRLYDSKSRKLKELVKLNHELNCDFDEVILKVKLIGIDFNHDFVSPTAVDSAKNQRLTHSHSRHSQYTKQQAQPHQIVPGFKIIGKIHQSRSSSFVSSSNKKYLLFPFSNCILQNQKQLCHQCQFLLNKQVHTSSSFSALHNRYQCLNNFVYGFNIDGGFQDYLKIPHPQDCLVEIPKNVSLHDSLFLFDTMLPFYAFLKTSASNIEMLNTGKVLIILNDLSKELNDILIVLNHFKQINQGQVSIVDYSKLINSSSSSKYHKKFDQILIFNNNQHRQSENEVLKLIQVFSASNGLETTKSRYNVIMFNNWNQTSHNFPNQLQQQHQQQHQHKYLINNDDKTIHHFKLSHKDKEHLEQVLAILSNLNSSFQISSEESNQTISGIIKPRVSIGSLDSSISTSSSSTASSVSSSMPNTPLNESSPASFSSGSFQEDHHHHHHHHHNQSGKNLRFKDTTSIISNSDTRINKKKSSTQHWLHCDYDFDLIKNDEEEDEDNDDVEDTKDTRSAILLKKSHNINHINKLIQSGLSSTSLSRVCYNNKSNKPTKLNAFIFC